MLKKILWAGVVGLGLFLGVAALKDPHYAFSRERTLTAAPAAVWPWLVSSRKANEWMPWIDGDPQIKMTFEGPEQGVGSKAVWISPGPMGEGESEIVEIEAMRRVVIKITYRKPMVMHQMARFELEPSGTGSLVRWSVEGEHGFVGRIFSMVMSIDKVVGGEFEKGLAKLEGVLKR